MLTNQQSAAIEKLNTLKVGALFMEPGTGKTRTAVELVRGCGVASVLWLTPCQTKANLASEIELCGGVFGLTIIGIESLQNSDREYLRAMSIVEGGDCFVVCDESLKIKNFSAKRTKRILELGKLATYRLILNGTPITRNLLDVWSQFEFLSPKILNMGLPEFQATFCEEVTITKRVNGRSFKKSHIDKYVNVDYLYSLIAPYVYECELELLVNREYKELFYKLSDEDMEAYKEVKKKTLDNENLMFFNNNIFLQMTQKMQHGYCCTEGKFEILKELLQGLDLSKVIIYCKFITSYEGVKKLYPSVCVLTYGKHSLGLNLQKYNVTIFFDKTFDYSQMVQSEFRTFRTGQTEDCRYFHLTGNVGLESMIQNNIVNKQSLLEQFKKAGHGEIEKLIKEL